MSYLFDIELDFGCGDKKTVVGVPLGPVSALSMAWLQRCVDKAREDTENSHFWEVNVCAHERKVFDLDLCEGYRVIEHDAESALTSVYLRDLFDALQEVATNYTDATEFSPDNVLFVDTVFRAIKDRLEVLFPGRAFPFTANDNFHLAVERIASETEDRDRE